VASEPAAEKAPDRPSVASGPAAEKAAERPSRRSDPVVEKAKATVAAKMEEPSSAVFDDMTRAMRKNALGDSVDTICGHVRGKKPSGEDTGERPFLYVVKEDAAYVVADSGPASVEAVAYRTICTAE
jgi:hypothetical protein